MYDFDRTLCTRDMQEYSFIPSMGMTGREFWSYANELGSAQHMDSVLAYMYAMVKLSGDKNMPIRRDALVKMGKTVEFFKGVEDWFDRISDYGSQLGIRVEHYVISSGLREIIEGTRVSSKFKSIFACEFLYDENGAAVWPKTDVNYTNKTQFVYRINKGVLDVANDIDLNRSMPEDDKKRDGKVEDLLRRDRVDYIYPADYSEGEGLDLTVKNILTKIAVNEVLYNESVFQKNNLT